MEIFKTFGLDPILTIAQIVNFLIILYVLKRFLYKPLFKILKKREELVRESVKKAEDSAKLLAKAQDQEKETIKKAQETAKQIIKDAKDQSEEILKQAEVTTKQQTDKMIQDAKEQIALETSQAQAKLDTYVVNLSLNLLRKSLPNVFSEKEQSEIIEKAMKEMQKQPN